MLCKVLDSHSLQTKSSLNRNQMYKHITKAMSADMTCVLLASLDLEAFAWIFVDSRHNLLFILAYTVTSEKILQEV